MDLKCLKDIARNFVAAILDVSATSGEPDDDCEVAPQHVVAACAAIRIIMPTEDDPAIWEVVQRELLAFLETIKKAECSLCQCDDVSDVDLTLLELISMAKIHLGLAMGLVLCPPSIDPLTFSAIEHLFLCGIVSSGLYCLSTLTTTFLCASIYSTLLTQ